MHLSASTVDDSVRMRPRDVAAAIAIAVLLAALAGGLSYLTGGREEPPAPTLTKGTT